jgi:hypothetical protein
VGDGMRSDDKNLDTTAEKVAWEMFSKTGNVSYYMLYNKLKRK